MSERNTMISRRQTLGGQVPSRLWVDPPAIREGGQPIVLAYPDGSTARGTRAFIAGVSELVYRPEGYPDGKHVALETFADVELEP